MNILQPDCTLARPIGPVTRLLKSIKDEMSSTLQFLCGKMAAGKTTLAKQLASEYSAISITWDVWLQRLFPVEIRDFGDFLRCSGRLKSAMAPHIAEILASGRTVVLDFPANTPEARQWVRSIFEQAACPHILHFLDRSDARCLTQLAMRNDEWQRRSNTEPLRPELWEPDALKSRSGHTFTVPRKQVPYIGG